MVKPMSGVLDGVSLSYLAPGGTYDVNDGLARYLISVGAAEELDSTQPALIPPLDDRSIAHLTGGVTVTGANFSADDVADDRPARIRPFPKRN
jgi:hypothetical protein